MEIFFKFFYWKHNHVLQEISEQDYHKIFIEGRTKEEIGATYRQAWNARNFEIEHYWKRANYFWAFQIASFAGYFSVLSSKAYLQTPQILYFVVCIGFITALAWTLTNRGSKSWQRHWEVHVDLLENEITGPLYKTITTPKTFSVSKLNEIVSQFIVAVWILTALKYFSEHVSFANTTTSKIDYLIWLSSLTVLYFTGAMFFGHGRARFGDRKVTIYLRNFSTIN